MPTWDERLGGPAVLRYPAAWGLFLAAAWLSLRWWPGQIFQVLDSFFAANP